MIIKRYTGLGIIVCLIGFLNLSLVSASSFSWDIEENVEINFTFLLEEENVVELDGIVTLKLESIQDESIKYSVSSNFEVDLTDYQSSIDTDGSNTSTNGKIENFFYYPFVIVYSQTLLSNMKDVWRIAMAEQDATYWDQYGDNDSISYDCNSNARGYSITFTDNIEDEIWYLQAKYSTDGVLEHFAYGLIADEGGYVWEATREGFQLFGYYIPGYDSFFLILISIISVTIGLTKMRKKKLINLRKQ